MNITRSAYILLNSEFRIIKLDPDAITYFEPLADTVTNEILWQVLPSLKEEKHHLFFENCIQQHKPYSFEINLSEFSAWTRWVIYPSDNGLACCVTDITNEIARQHQLKDYQNKMSSLLDNTQEGILFLDTQGKILSFNKTIYDRVLTNTGKKLLIGANFDEFIYQGGKQNFYKAFNNAKQGIPDNIDLHVKLNGADYWFNSSHSPVFDSSGKVVGVTIISNNITEKKEAENLSIEREKMLTDSEVKLRSILDSANETVVLMGLDYRVLCFNKIAERTFNELNRKQIKEGEDFRNLIIQENMEVFLQAFELAKHGETTIVERQGAKQNGEFWFEHKVNPVYGKHNEIIGVMLISGDITLRKKAELSIKRSEEKFRKMIEFSPLPMLIINEDLAITIANPAAQELLGYTQNELQSKYIKDFSDNRSGESLDLISVREKQLKNIGFGEVIELQKKNGEFFFAEAKFGAFESETGGYTVLTLQNISERIKFEFEITKYNRELNLLNKVNDVILVAEHEFDLYDKVCETIISDDSYCLAWIGLTPNTYQENGVITPIAKAGVVNYLNDLSISIHNTSTNKGPTATALINGTTVTTNNVSNTDYYKPWSENAQKFGIRSSVAIAIKFQDEILGVLNVYSPNKGAFDTNEVNILGRLANNVALAVKGIRNKIEKERTAYQLNERVKEIKAIYEINNILKEESEFDVILNKITDRLPDGWQYPDNCGVLVCFDGVTYVSKLYKPSKFKLKAAGRTHDNKLFELEVVYINETPPEDEGPFLKEERNLINTITELFVTYYNTRIIHQQLRASESNLKSVFENTDVGHLLLDKNYKIVSFNNSLRTGYALISGIQIELNKNMVDSLLEFRREVFVKILESVRQKKVPYAYDMSYEYKGKAYHFSMNIVPVFEGNEFNGYSISAYDITRRKQLEMERQKVIDDIVQRNRDLEQFSYIVSHNIRSPLATLLGFSNLLKADLNEREKAFIFKGLEKSAQKLDNTIRDVNEILNVKKEISQSKQNVNLNELMQSVLGSIEGLIKSSDAQIEYDFSEIKEIKSVKPYIHSIFLNLISNAIKYARRNVEPVIEIKSSKQGNYLVLKFKDNGTGIDLAKYGDQLFGLYKKFNLDVEGKGMGLFMVKTQVNAMGGSIEVESTLNEGATFIVKLPL